MHTPPRDAIDGASPSGLAQEVGKRHPFSSIETEVYLNLLRTTERLAEQFDALFKSQGLSHSQYNAMRILRGHDKPVPSGVVAREMVKREPDITRLLYRLVEAGYVSRERSASDKRVVLARLTAEGAAMLAQLDEPVRELHKQQLSHMTPEELRSLSDLLERARVAIPPNA